MNIKTSFYAFIKLNFQIYIFSSLFFKRVIKYNFDIVTYENIFENYNTLLLNFAIVVTVVNNFKQFRIYKLKLSLNIKNYTTFK